MNRAFLSSLVALLLSASAMAQETEPLSRTVFKMSPQHFTDNALKAGVERFNKKHSTSLLLMVTAKLNNNPEFNFDMEAFNGLGGELQIRKYISPMKKSGVSKRGTWYHQGVYGAAYVQGGSFSGDFKGSYTTYDPTTGGFTRQVNYDYYENIGNWGLGFTIGYQRTFWQVIFVEAFIGGGIQFSDTIGAGTRPEPEYTYIGITHPAYRGMLPKMGVNIGIGL